MPVREGRYRRHRLRWLLGPEVPESACRWLLTASLSYRANRLNRLFLHG